jgi:cytochrome c oxidase subunit III
MSSAAYPPINPPRSASAASARSARSGVWVAMFAITMSFAAFTSAMFVRQGSTDWIHLAVPPILFVNTLLLVFSSFTLEFARRAVRAKTIALLPSLADLRKARIAVSVTLLLGLAFIAGQYLAWRQLAAQGFFLASNPNSSFFYVFTGVHALHVLGGLAALLLLLFRIFQRSPRLSLLPGVSLYWHFMCALWLYLLFIICTRL